MSQNNETKKRKPIDEDDLDAVRAELEILDLAICGFTESCKGSCFNSKKLDSIYRGFSDMICRIQSVVGEEE